MSDEDQSANSAEPKPKKLNIDALLPAKASVNTSIGTIYVRHAYTNDWEFFDTNDVVELGRVSVQRLCNRFEGKRDSSPLLDDDLNSLSDADYQALVQTIAKQSGWRELPAGSGLKELGDVIKEEKLAITERREKMLGDLQRSIGTSYSFLGKGELKRLQGQMAGLADIRNSLAGTASFQSALRAASLQEEAWRKPLSGIDSIAKAMRGIDAAQIEIPKYEPPKFVMPPSPEETRLGRATLESAENSRQVVEKMDALVVVVAGLNQTMVQDVLPAWFNKIEEEQKSAKNALGQAASGLWWTKWAVITSVLVTILATWWQVDIAKSIDRENSKQQTRAETVLREQLVAQQKLLEQQAKDAVAMREVIATMRDASSYTKPKK